MNSISNYRLVELVLINYDASPLFKPNKNGC